MLSPELSRGARALLCWSQSELAQNANLNLTTIRDFETGARPLLKNNLLAIQNALENAGIVFEHDHLSNAASIRRVSRWSNCVVVADPRWPAGARRVCPRVKFREDLIFIGEADANKRPSDEIARLV